MLETTSVKAVDTTGAGDAFIGAFSYGLSVKMSTVDSLKLGLEKATNSVTKKGTQSSYRD
jgi:ribokinase